jgi:farnesol dehydrogenase
MRVLLTGGTGFLGRNVTQRLLAAGHEVRLLVRPGRKRALPPAATEVPGDVVDAPVFAKAALGCEAILHMAALVKTWVPNPAEFDRVNVGGLTNALAAAKAAGARLVYTSSFIAVGPTGATPATETQVHPGGVYRNHYERTKALADARAREAAAAGQDVVLLYPGVVYGPGELTDANLVVKMIRDHLHGKMPGIVGPGDRRWCYAFADDVAEAHVAALTKGRRGERYFLGGENATMNELFALVHELASVPPPRWHIPYGVASALGLVLYGWAELTGAAPELTHREVAVFREHWAYACDKASAELGYRATPLREGLRTTLRWLQDQELVSVPAGASAR